MFLPCRLRKEHKMWQFCTYVWNALSLIPYNQAFASLTFHVICTEGYLPGGGIRGGAVLTVGGGGRKGGGGRWVGGAPGGKNGGGLVKLSTSGLDRSERTCKISNYSYNCYVKRVEDRLPLFPVTTTGKYYLCS